LYPNWGPIELCTTICGIEKFTKLHSYTPWNDLFARNITIADDGRVLFSIFCFTDCCLLSDCLMYTHKCTQHSGGQKSSVHKMKMSI